MLSCLLSMNTFKYTYHFCVMSFTHTLYFNKKTALIKVNTQIITLVYAPVIWNHVPMGCDSWGIVWLRNV